MRIVTHGWMSIALGLLVVLPQLVACDRATDSEMDDLVDIGTHSLHIRCTGNHSPTVVLDTGLGDPLDRWQPIQAQVGRYTRVCAYDRAGYGSSEPGPMPRHSQQMVDELKRLLEDAGVKGPYVLVGHSLGGLNVQLFASRYPDLVAGLILLDPPPLRFITGQAFSELYRMAEQQTSELRQAAEAARQATDAEGQARAAYLDVLASEHAMFITEGGARVAAIESFGDMPLVVIGSGKPNPAFGEEAEVFQQFWIEQSRALATKSTDGTFVLAQESGHYLHEDVPDLVLNAIRRMVEQVRGE